jgi:hypothetical protein
MKSRSLRLPLVAALAMLLVIPFSAKSSTIFWGSLNNDFLYDSNGAPLNSDFVFEVGIFDTTGGWTPTSANMSEWAGRWMLFDRAATGSGWNANDQLVESTVDHTITGGSSAPEANATHVFPQGAQAYLWVYDTQDFIQGAEWALVADFNKATNIFGLGWEFPNPAEQSGESYDWQTRDLDTAIFGGVNNVQGAGTFSVNPGIFTIQTHVVPEPGSALLLLAAGSGLLRRRRQQAQSF